MGIFSIFQKGNYFDKSMNAKCDYCQFGKRAKDGNKIICEKRGLVDPNNSCGKFVYSPLKRIPVKQLNFVGSMADEDIYIESAGDRAEKEAAQKALEEKNKPKAKKEEPKPEPKPAEEKPVEAVEKPAEEAAPAEDALAAAVAAAEAEVSSEAE